MKSKALTAIEIIEKYLEENGFDGLCGGDYDPCGCIRGDLAPCDYGGNDCVPAYQYEPIEDAETNCPDYSKCEAEHSGCLYNYDADFILCAEDRQCACRSKVAGGKAGA
jgi:hypothetical protein